MEDKPLLVSSSEPALLVQPQADAAAKRSMAKASAVMVAVVVAAMVGVTMLAGMSTQTITTTGQLVQSASADVDCDTVVYMTTDKKCNSYDSPVLSGFDVTEYFSLDYDAGDEAVQGLDEYTATYMGYTFYFASSANQAVFEANPSLYAPAYGGFCAYGVSGYDGNNFMTKQTQLWSTPVDVNEYAVIDGTLYMFRGSDAREFFVESSDTDISGGDGLWSSWFGECAGFFNTECYM